MAEFANRVTLRVQAGHGGHGCASIHREKFKPLGGPDGGNGGRGGDVILEVDASAATLLDFHRRPVRRAGNGRQGEGSNRTGADGADLIIAVPNGTEVKTADGEVLADLVGVGTRFVAAAGGRGGLGNAALASPRRKAPGFALKGEPGQQRDLILELKTVADVGLVGFPNAGKSSLIAAMSAARPKIADYPFTTLIPNLGVVEAGDVQFVVADVPGLIPGASQGRGLGHDFLRHVERCSTLVHVLDCATEEPGRSPAADLAAIEKELAAYGDATGAELVRRPRLIALNKIDVPGRPRAGRGGEGPSSRPAATRSSRSPPPPARACASWASRWRRWSPRTARPARPSCPPSGSGSRSPSRPPTSRASRWSGSGDSFLIRGEKPQRWVRQTDFSNDEAVGYLADRLARLGVEEALAEAGAEPGAEVLIGDPDDAVVFDWDPGRPDEQRSQLVGPARQAQGPQAAPRPPRHRPPPVMTDEPERRRPAAGHRHGVQGRGQGGLLVADHDGRRDRRRGDRGAGCRPRGPLAGQHPARPGLLGGDRLRSGPARAVPAAPRPGHPAGGSQRRPGPAYRQVHGRLRPARHPHRPGPAVRRRPDAPDPLPQRPAHPGPAAGAGRAAGGQRERHGGHRRDQVRRQRPAGRPGGARDPGRRAHPALGRGWPVRRRPAPRRGPADHRDPRASRPGRGQAGPGGQGRPGRQRQRVRPRALAAWPPRWKPR